METMLVLAKCTGKQNLPKGQNYLFHRSFPGAKDAIVKEVHFVAISNDSIEPVTVLPKSLLGALNKYEEDRCYLVKGNDFAQAWYSHVMTKPKTPESKDNNMPRPNI